MPCPPCSPVTVPGFGGTQAPRVRHRLLGGGRGGIKPSLAHPGASRGAAGTGNMENALLCLLCLLGSGLVPLGTPEPVPELRPTLSLPGHGREETELVEVLREVLDELGTREPPALEKRLSWVPWCEPREPCAVRRGARIGKLCSCPRGTSCNLFILKCS
ncbi:cocaine- and amphetamine-regulated transcript protein-like [Anomalospiza imberbis]|uniref:cocaine- and amphetamine-regulated transcript protein-like n=1 Tax=Anomalospiza imberbis TaxID=187417 RepID=UPI00358FFD28